MDTRAMIMRTGQVVSPVPVDDPDFEGYVDRCLRTWSVDVLTDSGEYLPNVRVVNSQGNSREGTRSLPRLPSLGPNGEEVPGDLVVIQNLYGSFDHAVILGTLAPYVPPGVTADDQEAEMVTTRDINETISRKEYIDTEYEERPLYMAVTTRSTGIDIEHEHSGETLIDGKPRASHRLERVQAARSVQLEHRVVIDDDTVATLRESNTDASEIKSIHAVKTKDGVSSVTTVDLQAQVLQLAHKVQELGELLLISDKAKKARIEQNTENLHVMMYMDSDAKMVSTLVEDKGEGSQAQWMMGPKSEFLLRRVDGSGKQTRIAFNADNSLTVQTPGGEAIHLDDQAVLITSTGSSIRVAEDTGISVRAADGAMLTVDQDAIIAGENVSIAGSTIHLNTGGLLIGNVPAAAKSIPAAEMLAIRMQQIELALQSIAAWARSHTHVSSAPGSPTSPSVVPLPPTAAPVGLFNLVTDTLKSLKAV